MSADKIMLLGVNHKTAPVEIRERLAFTDNPGAPYMALQAIPGCEEFCFLSTCNRVEVLFSAADGDVTERKIREFLFAGSMSYEEAEQYIYLHKGEDSINHLFRVGLDQTFISGWCESGLHDSGGTADSWTAEAGLSGCI